MLLFLPPAEAKVTGGDLPALRGRLGRGAVGSTRRAVLTEVAALSRRDPAAAARALNVPAGAVAEATAWNRDVLDSPTCPALRRYAGVVYQSLDPATLTAPQLAVADRSIRIFSGGFGYLGAADPVPAYRVPAAARLPRLGGLAAVWRPVLREVVTADVADHLVVDLRSTDYAGLWAPPAGVREQVVVVRVLTRRPTAAGVVESVVSYNSKHVKGLLVRALVRAAARGRVETVARVAAVVEASGYEVRVREVRGAPALDVVEDMA